MKHVEEYNKLDYLLKEKESDYKFHIEKLNETVTDALNKHQNCLNEFKTKEVCFEKKVEEMEGISLLLKKRVKVTILPSHQLWSFELTDEIQQKIYTIKNGSELQTLSHPKIPLKPSIKPSGVFCELDEDEDPPNHIKPLKHPYEPLDEEEVLYGPLCPKHSMLPNFWNQQKDKLLLGCEFQN